MFRFFSGYVPTVLETSERSHILLFISTTKVQFYCQSSKIRLSYINHSCQILLKSGVNDSSSKMLKIAFCFILVTLFILKISKFLS